MELRCICGAEPMWSSDDDGPLGENHIIQNFLCPNCKAWIEIHHGLHEEDEDE